MQKLIIGLAILTLVCCKPAKEKPEMAGAYNMLSQSMNDGKADSAFAGGKQLKIYGGDYMMFARFSLPDSSSSFGISSYTSEAGGVTENQIYSATNDTRSEDAASFKLEIEKSATGFKQVIRDINYGSRKITLTEEYESVTAAKPSPLEGAWRELKHYTVKGKDTTKVELTEFKTYFGGHFIFGATYLDSAKKVHTGVGYGTYEMTGDKVKETVDVSTFPQIVGQTYSIDIEMQGPDKFRQSTTRPNGSKDIEEYERLKK